MKKKGRKRTNSQSEVESESQKETTKKKVNKSSSKKKQQISEGFDKLTLQKISQEVHTMASNELQSPKSSVTQSRRVSIKQFESITKSLDLKPQPKQLCIPLLPATFADWVHYEAKCRQIEFFLDQGFKKQGIIAWIEDNNMLNNCIETNCQLLSEIQSQQFWNVIVREMLSDVVRFSDSLHNEKIKFLTLEDYGSKKLQIGRGLCYLILLQWFFGLLPPQYYLSKHQTHCTFASYMYKQSIEQKSELVESDRIRLIKLKSIVSYFSFMSIEEYHQALQKQSVVFECGVFKMKQNYFLNVQQNDKRFQEVPQFQDDFGQIGDEYFTTIKLRDQSEDKINSVKMSQQIYAFFEINTVLKEEKFEILQNNFELEVFLLQHPQAFIAKLLFQGFANEDLQISVRNLRRWSICQYSKRHVLQGYLRIESKSIKNSKNISRLVLSKHENNEQLTIEDYTYERLKLKIQKYVNLIKASIKAYKEKQIVINFDSMKHKDITLNFMLMWMAVSQATRSKCKFIFEISKLSKSTKFNLSKLYKYFQGKDIADFLSVLKGYEMFFIEKKQFFTSPKDISFIDYIKKHVF